jgi:DNA-binding transcriptional regulator GbsR (MarR family)
VKESEREFDEKLKKYEQLLVKFHEDIGRSKRVNEKFIIIGTYLFLYDKLTQADLVNLTDFSSGTISTYLSVMEGMGFINKQRIPKTHTFKYGITIPINKLLTDRYDSALKSVISLDAFLNKKLEELEPLIQKSKTGAQHLSKRIQQLLNTLEYYKEIYSTLE